MSKLFTRLCLFVCLVGSATFAAADWKKFSSDNFSAYSSFSERKSKKILEDLERFKFALHRVLGVGDSGELPPVTIFMFNDEAEFHSFVSKRNVVGLFVDGSSGAIMLIGPDKGALRGEDILYHEYTHYLMNSVSNVKYPLWYSEGVAELFTTAEVLSSQVILGRVPQWRAWTLRKKGFLPVSEIFSPLNPKNAAYSSHFYASSWLLTHYLMMNKSAENRQAMGRYFQLYNNGMGSADAFWKAFGMNEGELKQRLKKYSRKNTFNVSKIPLDGAVFAVNAEPVTEIEAEEELALLALELGAQETYAKITSGIDSSDSALKNTFLAMESAEARDLKQAEGYIESALSMGSEDPRVQRNIARVYMMLADKSLGDAQMLRELAVDNLEQSQAETPNADAAQMLADLYWELGDPEQGLRQIVQLYQLRPSSVSANMFAGKYMARLNAVPQARFFLGNVINWSHSEEQVENAKAILAALE